ncbi:MAG: methyltransferase domain-containing protein [Calditrichia bacterium]
MKTNRLEKFRLAQRDFFNDQAKEWDREETPEKLEALDRIFSRLRLPLDGKILDVGCGTGILVPILKKMSHGRASIIELDHARQMVLQNRNRWIARKRKVVWINADAHQLPLSKESVNAIICFAVYPHFQNKELALREFHRILKHNGFLLILHLMSSERLNVFHRKAGEEVRGDRLEPVEKLAEKVARLGFSLCQTREQDDLYLLLGKKVPLPGRSDPVI